MHDDAEHDRGGRWMDICLIGTEILIGCLFAAIFVLELINVILRHGFESGLPQTAEGVAFALAVITFLGMAPAFMHNEHVRLEVVQRWFAGRARTAIVVLAEVLTFLTLIYFAVLGVDNAVKFYDLPFTPSSLPWLPYWVPMTAVPVGAALGALAMIRRWHLAARDRRHRDAETTEITTID